MVTMVTAPGDLTPCPLFHKRWPMLGANIGRADITSAARAARVADWVGG